MVLFTNVRIFDGSGSAPFPGDVLVNGTRIEAIVRAGEPRSAAAAGTPVVARR